MPKGKPYFQEKGGKDAQKKGKNKKASKSQKGATKQMPFSRKVPV